jgi:hypothetical protein
MRNGVILEENSPNNLLDKYKAESLEQVFLMLSEQQHMASKYETNNNEVSEQKNLKRLKKYFDNDNFRHLS